MPHVKQLEHPKPPVSIPRDPKACLNAVERAEVAALDRKPRKYPKPETEKARVLLGRLETSVRQDPEKVSEQLVQTRLEWETVDRLASSLSAQIGNLEEQMQEMSVKVVRKFPDNPALTMADRMRQKSQEREAEQNLLSRKSELLADLQTTESRLLAALGEWRDFRSLVGWLENLRVEQLAKLIDFVSDGREVQRCVVELLRLVDRPKVLEIIYTRARNFQPLPLEGWMVEQLVNVCQLHLEFFNGKISRKRPTALFQRGLLDMEAPEIIRKWCARKCQVSAGSPASAADGKSEVRKKATEITEQISRYFEERMRVDRLRLVHEADAHRASEDLLFCANALAFLIGKSHAEAVTRRNVLAPITYT